MITVQLLTKNNEATIQQCLESILPLKPQILVADLGSTDSTIEICERHGKVIRAGSIDRAAARNALIKLAKYEQQMAIEPWEALAKGRVQNLKHNCSYATIINRHLLSKELRFWKGPHRFVDPVYERLDANTDYESDVIFYCIGSRNYNDDLLQIEKWKKEKPTIPAPYYYQACIYFARQEYEAFYPIADHYLFLEPKFTMSSVMMRYYYAMATLLHQRKARPTLQNINLCLCAQPLMAEFWCLMADTYYHLLKKFDFAKSYYENALILGSRRLKTDKWPMDITKYGSYPKMMIESCNRIIESTATYKGKHSDQTL